MRFGGTQFSDPAGPTTGDQRRDCKEISMESQKHGCIKQEQHCLFFLNPILNCKGVG